MSQGRALGAGGAFSVVLTGLSPVSGAQVLTTALIAAALVSSGLLLIRSVWLRRTKD